MTTSPMPSAIRSVANLVIPIAGSSLDRSRADWCSHHNRSGHVSRWHVGDRRRRDNVNLFCEDVAGEHARLCDCGIDVDPQMLEIPGAPPMFRFVSRSGTSFKSSRSEGNPGDGGPSA